MINLIKKRIDFAISFGLVSKVGIAIIGILTLGLLTRFLSIKEAAIFFLFLQAIKFLGVFLTFGYKNVIQKKIGILYKDQKNNLIRNVIKKVNILLLIKSLIIFVLFIFFWPKLNATFFNGYFSYFNATLIFCIGLLRSIELLLSAYFRSKRDYFSGTILLGLPRDLLILVYVFISSNFYELTLHKIINFYFFVSLIIVSYFILQIYYKDFFKGKKTKLCSEEESYSALFFLALPMNIYLLSNIVYTTSDLWIIRYFLLDIDVALYAAATKLVALLILPLTIINYVIPSVIASSFKRGDLEILELVSRGSAFIVSLAAALIFIFFTFFDEKILEIIFGDGYQNASIYLNILVFGYFMSAFCGSPGVVLQMTGSHKILTVITLIIAIINVCLNIIFVQKFGAMGVAIVTSLSLFINNIIITILVYRRIQILTIPFVSISKIRDFFKIIRAEI